CGEIGHVAVHCSKASETNCYNSKEMRGLLSFFRGLHTVSNRQAKRKAGIVGSRCGLCGTQSVNKPQPRFGLLFDIDGVLVRGRMLIPAAKVAFEKLVDSQGQFVVPVVFVTNAGNCLRQTKADQLSHILGVPMLRLIGLTLLAAVVLFGEPIRWETNLQLIIDVLLTNGNLNSPHQPHGIPQLPLLACNMDLMWMAEANSPRFGHGTFLVCLENIYKKITGIDLKYEALMGKPSELTYHFAEYLIRSQAMQRQWKLPITSLYAIGSVQDKPILAFLFISFLFSIPSDNLMTDIYGANLYNRFLEERAARKNPKAVAKVAAATGSSTAMPGGEEEIDSMWESELALPSATSCKSILVCTGVYNPNAEVPSDANRCIKETVFHGHRDFRFDPALVEPGHIVQDIAEAVDLIFQQEKFVPQ
ncbi:hypothetical protein GOODEAATRI_011089, partial [Goodea atripinnis]